LRARCPWQVSNILLVGCNGLGIEIGAVCVLSCRRARLSARRPPRICAPFSQPRAPTLAGADTHTDEEFCSQEPGAGRRQVAHAVRPQACGPAGSLFAILLWGGGRRKKQS
jgi:hypothetical protein